MKAKLFKNPSWGVLCAVCIVLSSFFITSCMDDESIEPTSITSPNSDVGDAVSISNSGFESGETGWIFTDPFAISGESNSGSNSGKITGSGGEFEQSVSVNANTNYTLSAYIKDAGTIGATVGGTSTEDGGDYSDWTQVSVTFNSGSNTSVTIYGEYNGDEGRFDDFTLIEGEGSSNNSDNLALNRTATQSSTAYSGVASRAVDGDTNGNWAGGSVTHTNASDDDHWWQVDLGSSQSIGDIVIYNRTNSCCTSRLSDFTVIVLDGNGNTSFSQFVSSLSSSSITIDAGSNSGRYIRIEKGGDALSLAEVEVFAGEGNSTDYTSLPAQIEAEDYDDASEGRTETTTDSGGGLNVGWINTNEYLSYNVNVPSSGTYTIDLRVASLNSSINLDIYQDNSLVGSVSEGSTGGWQSWTTVSTSVNLSSGNSILKIVATGNNWNINWFEVSTGGPSGGTVEDILGTTWKVTVPYDSDGNDSGNVSDPDDRNSDAEDYFDLIEASEDFPNNFYVDGNEVIFTAHCGGATTSGSIYPRTELRQLDEDGDDNYFDLDDYQYLDVTVRVLEVPTERPEVNMVQIHGPSDEPLRVEYNAGSDGLHLTINEDDDGWEDVIGYSLGDRLRVQVTVDDGRMWLVLNNLETGEVYDDIQGVDLDDDTGYFKVGCYLQSSITYCEEKNKDEDECTDDAPSAKGTVAVSNLTLVSTW